MIRVVRQFALIALIIGGTVLALGTSASADAPRTSCDLGDAIPWWLEQYSAQRDDSLPHPLKRSASTQVVRRLSSELATTFPGMTSLSFRLDDSSILIVVDPERASSASAIASHLRSMQPALDLPWSVVVGCTSRAEFSIIQDAIREAAGLATGKHRELSSVPDPGSGRVVLTTPDPYTSPIVSELRERYGDRILAIAGAGNLDGRYDDNTPHHGASQVRSSTTAFGAPGYCTANATIVGFLDLRYMPTAGHCTNGSATFTSGPYAFGTTVYRSPNWPTADLALIAAPVGHVYTNVIHTEPTHYSRNVIGQRDASNLETICISGATSHNKCNLTVVADASISMFCFSLGCIINLDLASVPLADHSCVSGDSGAPYYGRYSGAAKIQGLHHAHVDIHRFGIALCFYSDATAVSTLGNYLTVP